MAYKQMVLAASWERRFNGCLRFLRWQEVSVIELRPSTSVFGNDSQSIWFGLVLSCERFSNTIIGPLNVLY